MDLTQSLINYVFGHDLMWVCPSCFEKNDKDSMSCIHCSEPKPFKDQGTSNAVTDDNNTKTHLPTPGATPTPKSRTKLQTPVAVSEKKMAKVQPLIKDGIDKRELRMVLIGKTGVGKSSTANTILGDEKAFNARASAISVTKKCHFERRERFEKRVLLVDTPGLFDTSTSKKIVDNEIKKCIGISAPGPHAFLLVMSCTNRFTEEEKKVLEEVSNMFGDQMIKYLIVVFTGRDQIDKGSCIEKHIEEYPEEFRRLVMQAGGGYISFNNRGSDFEKEEGVENLLNRIDQMVKKNGGGHFTSEMFEAAENAIQQRIANELAAKEEEIRKEIEDDIRKELEEEMRGKYSDELSRLKELRKEDLLQYEILKRELDKEHRKNEKETKTERNLKGAFRPLIIDEMRANAEKNLIQQIEKCEGPERAEVHRQLATAGQEIQQLLQRRRKMADPDASEGEAEAEDEGTQEPEINAFQENAYRATEEYLVDLRDNEREDIKNEKGALQMIKEKMSGILSPFLSLFS